MKKIILFSTIIAAQYSFAYTIPTIAVPNLVYTKTEKTPVTQTTSSVESGIVSTNTTTTVLKEQVQKELPMFNADVRGALINSKQFRVVDIAKANKLWTGNTQTVLNFVNGMNKSGNKNVTTATVVATKIESGSSIAKLESQAQTSNNNLPDYILLGQISSITSDADIEPLQDTNKITSQYNIDISVDYQVVGTKDGSIIASFNGYGHANDVKILNAGDTVQVQNHNIPLLINQASKDLANNVVTQLQQQFSVSSKTYNIESVENLKVYN